MALDWNKLNQQKARLEERLSKGSGGPRARFWKPSDGENRIRIMPAWTAEGSFAGQFWREVSQHWGVSEEQRGPVLCPKNTPYLEGDCPICELVDQLRADKGDVRAQEAAKNIRAKTAFLLNVVDVDDSEYSARDVADYKKARPDAEIPFEVGDVKVQVYACPSTVFNQILNTIQVNQIDVTDPAEGHDVIIKKTGKGLTTRYDTTIVLKPSEAPAVEELPTLSDVGYQMKYDEMLKLASEGVGAEFAGLLPSQGTQDDDVALPPADGGDLRAELRAKLA